MRQLLVRTALVVALLTGACSSSAVDEADTSTVGSVETSVLSLQAPDSGLAIEIGLTARGEPAYRVQRDGASIVSWSRLGAEVTVDANNVSLADQLEVESATEPQTSVDEYQLPTGKARRSSVTAVTQSVVFAHASDHPSAESGVALAIDLWLSDDAVALRSRVSAPEDGDIRLDWERTSFSFPPDARSWLQGYDQPTRFTPAYEQLYAAETTAAAPRSSGNGWSFPALFASEAGWTLLTEAGMESGQAGSHLAEANDRGQFVVALPHPDEGQGVGERHPEASGELTTPWRLFISSPELATVVASNAVRHLAASPSADALTPEWIQPGRVSWSWWSDHASSRDADRMADFVDLAATLGWEYSLVDANWDEIPDTELAALIEHAEANDVGLLFWYNSGGPNNVVTEAPRDLMTDREIRRAEFRRIADLGIAGVKVDFFHSDKPVTMQQYQDILADALEAELLVNFHGSTLPRGWERRFPNLMTMEAVAGAEFYTFGRGYATEAPRHNTVLAFTRNVVGSMDYTPVILGDQHERRTTNGHELATAVIFESGLQHFADAPEVYLAQPPVVQAFLTEIPTVWDDTVLLSGEPDSHAVFARRHDERWFLGGINGTGQTINVTIPFDLATPPDAAAENDASDDQTKPSNPSLWTILCDDQSVDDGRTLEVRSTPIGDEFSLSLVANGGCVAWTGTDSTMEAPTS